MRWASETERGAARRAYAAGARRCRSRRGQFGFTLVEILVVLVILGLLFGLVAPRAIDYLSRAKTDVAKMQMENFATSLDLFRLDVGRYPIQEEGLRALVTKPREAERWNGPYLKDREVPLDPWDREYIYRTPGSHGGPYDLSSLGADGRDGGEDEDADLTNW